MASLIPAGISILGGLLSGGADKGANQAAAAGAQFNPFNVAGAGGAVDFSGQNVSISADPQTQMLQQLLQSGAMQNLSGGGAQGGFRDFASQLGSEGIPGLFSGAQAASSQIPSGAFGAFGEQAAAGANLGFTGGAGALGLSQQFGTSQTGINEPLAQGLFGRGMQAFGQTDFSGLAADQLARSRALARPGEERAVNAKFQNLFSRGQLGTTGGAQQVGALAQAQEGADIQRQFGADQFANMLGQQNRQFGMGLFGQGFGARAQDQAFNLGAGQLFSQQGQGLLGFGAGQAQAGLGAAVGESNLVNQRAQQRLSNATSLFGFGNELQQQQFQQGIQGAGASSQINQDLRNLLALSGNLSSAQAGAGANAGRFTAETGFSPFGEVLQGVGENVDFQNLFT